MGKKNTLFEQLKDGLEEAIEYEKGNIELQTTNIKIEKLPSFKGKQIKKIRNDLKLTQVLFAKLFGVSVKTIEAWEKGNNIPNGPSQRILKVLRKNPSSIELFGTLVTTK